MEATWLRNEHDDDAVSCVTPTAHDVTLSPQMSRSVVPVRLAPYAYNSLDGGRPIVHLRGAAYDTLLRSRDGPSGGTLVSIKGANLNRTSHCDCRFGTTEVPVCVADGS